MFPFFVHPGAPEPDRGIPSEGMVMRIQFLGGARQVTGSCYYVEVAGKRLLVDCGLFQEREFQNRNWDPTPIDPKSLDAVFLTHAHLDHSGRLPRLVKEGFNGPIHTTEPTVELAELVMQDSARLQQEDMEFKKKRHAEEGRQSPHPYEPLYAGEDVDHTMTLMHGIGYDKPIDLGDGVSARFLDAGHILGSAMVEITARENGTLRRLVFSGDMGQPNRPIVNDPAIVETADYVVLESTYGLRDHEHTQDITEQLADAVLDTHQRGGNVLIPTFAIERAQEVLLHLAELLHAKRIPGMMIFLDSPMAVNVLDIYRDYPGYMDDDTRKIFENRKLREIGTNWLRLVRTKRESQAINSIRGTCIIMAGAGMCTGGRIKHHLVHNIGRPGSTVVFVGYQASGTLGRQILDGASEVRLFGEMLPVRAQVRTIQGLSAHAGRSDLLAWLSHFKQPPRQLIVTHGEEKAALGLAEEVRRRMGWQVEVPQYMDTIELA